MKKIRVFIASAEDELKADLVEIGEFFRRLNDCYLDKGLYFSLVTPGDIGGVVIRRCKQEECLAEVVDSDIALVLFYANIESETLEEIEYVLNNFQKHRIPKIVAYRKTGPQPHSEDTGRFMDRLEQELGPCRNTYGHIDTLLLGILMQVKLMGLDCVSIRLESGKVLQDGDELLSLENVEMVSGHEELRRLKTELSRLDDDFAEAKRRFIDNPEDNDLYETICKISSSRNGIKSSVQGIEKRLYRLIESMYEQKTRGELSERQSESYMLIERGKFSEAKTILDYDVILTESRQADSLAEKASRLAQVCVNEHMQLAEVNKALGDWQGVDACYSEASRLETRHALPRIASMAYLKFLHGQNRQNESVKLAEQILYYYQSPEASITDLDKGCLYKLLGRIYQDVQRIAEAEEKYNAALLIFNAHKELDPEAVIPDLLEVYGMLGVLYCDTQRFDEAEAMHGAALDLQVKLSARYPDVYEPQMAASYSYLGDFYRETRSFAKAEKMNLSALEIRKRLAISNPDVYEPFLARAYNNLGSLYDDAHRFDEAQEMFISAMNIYVRMAEQNPDAYEPDLSDVYNNIGLSFMFTERLAESEDMHKKSLLIRKRLAVRNPEAFNKRLSNSYNSLGTVYYSLSRMPEAEEMFRAALEIRLNLMSQSPGAYETHVTDCYSNLGSVYQEMRRFDEAESMFRAARDMLIKLAARHPETYETDLADIMFNMGMLFRLALRKSDASEAFREAFLLYTKYEAKNPHCAKQASETLKGLESLSDLKEPGELSEILATRGALFTPGEREVALLLTEGGTQRDIARKLSLTSVEVARMVSSIREKVLGFGDPDPAIAAIIRAFKLSRREAHILKCLCSDMTNAGIAAELYIAEETVRVHIHRLLKKLPIENRQDVAAWARAFRKKTEENI